MNLYKISLMDAMAERNIAIFCKMNFVNSAVYFSDLQELSMRLTSIRDFYYRFFQKIEFLPLGVFMTDHVGQYDFTNLNTYDAPVSRIVYKIHQNELIKNDVQPIHLRYTEDDSMHLVVGLARAENWSNGYLHLIDVCLPKSLIRMVPQRVSYVKDIMESYDLDDKQSLRDVVRSKGYSYNHFQKDCKIYFGDTFYSFLLKLKMMEAVNDIVFTGKSLKEIAFKNKFLDYANMYKTFVRYGLNLAQIPRLANL